ncbi:uncharacterized protein METZ01_LOCUS405743, partial [marine metagenome]
VDERLRNIDPENFDASASQFMSMSAGTASDIEHPVTGADSEHL